MLSSSVLILPYSLALESLCPLVLSKQVSMYCTVLLPAPSSQATLLGQYATYERVGQLCVITSDLWRRQNFKNALTKPRGNFTIINAKSICFCKYRVYRSWIIKGGVWFAAPSLGDGTAGRRTFIANRDTKWDRNSELRQQIPFVTRQLLLWESVSRWTQKHLPEKRGLHPSK